MLRFSLITLATTCFAGMEKYIDVYLAAAIHSNYLYRYSKDWTLPPPTTMESSCSNTLMAPVDS